MKEFNVAVLTPTTGICRMGYAQCLAKLVAYFSQNRVYEECPTQSLITDSIEGSGIAENYERMVEKYFNDHRTRWTHFLSVEDDMLFSPDNLHRLAKHRVPIIGANYSTNKGSPLRFTSSIGAGMRCRTTPFKHGKEEVLTIPQGFTLVAREVYERMKKPWFLMGWNPETGEYQYPDGYFSMKARELGYKLYIDHDVSKHTWHYGGRAYSYQDALNCENDLLKKYELESVVNDEVKDGNAA